MQTINEIAANRKGVRGWLGEKIRQTADFEHWAAFLQSFLRLTDLIVRAASRASDGKGGPATVSVLSGDVHHSYAARAEVPESTSARVHQLVCSPVHNYVPKAVKPVFKASWSPRTARITRRLARHSGSPDLPIEWRNLSGPLFGNTIAALNTAGRQAEVVFEQPSEAGDLVEVARIPLTE
jgi:cytochrome c5